MVNRIQRFLRVSLAVAVIFFAACRSDSGSPRQPLIVATPQPLRVVIFVDQTASIQTARVPRVCSAAIAPLLDRIGTAGGEAALGFIRDRSDAPLIRVYVPEPPRIAVAPVAQGRSNVFRAAALKRRADAEQEQYSAAVEAWRRKGALRLNAFRSAIEPLLAKPNDARRTDIHAALLRAEVFVGEPTTFRHPSRSVVILVTDGVDTVTKAELTTFSGSAELLLVNGTGAQGTLGSLHPLRFESLDAAVRYVVGEGVRHA